MDWQDHDVYEAWRVVFGRISLPPPPAYETLFDRAIREVQEQEDRIAFEMLNGGPLIDPPNRFQKIDRGVLDNLAS